MFFVKFGPICSLEIHPSNMPPSKRQKTSDDSDEKKTAISQAVKSENDDLGENWREKCNGILATQAYALKKSILTDVTFLVGPESAVCHAHRLFLALGSPVFQAMFFGGLAEKGESVTIPDVSPEGFRHLLRYIYSEDIIFKSAVDAFKTYVAADKYCVTNLKVECEKYLNMCQLSASNVWMFLESSLFLNSQAISDRCLNFLQYNTDLALQHNSFLDVTEKTIENLMCLDTLNVTEMRLLLSVVAWAENKSNADPTLSFRSIFTPLLRFVRFKALTTNQFINFFEPQKRKELLEEKDELAILKHLCEPSICSLPEWCCPKTARSTMRMRSFCLSPYRKKFGSESRQIYEASDQEEYGSDSSMDACLSMTSSSSSSSASSSSSSSSSSD